MQVTLDGSDVDRVEGVFSAGGSDSITFSTDLDGRLDFRGVTDEVVQDSRLQITAPVRFWQIGAQADSKEESVLIHPSNGRMNEVSFTALGKSVPLNLGDLLLIAPTDAFYVRRFESLAGIQLDLHGVVRDVKVGIAPADLKTQMPSYFDGLDRLLKAFTPITVLVSLATTLVGLWQKIRSVDT